MMIHASIRMKFAARQFVEARDILDSLVERTRVSPGCLECYVYQDVRESRVLLYEQWWVRETDLDRHLRSELYGQVVLVMEMAKEFPVVRFSEFSATSGMETVAKSRGVVEPATPPP
jgi:quinol monooxygenase YgiN